ncbi:MAG: TSUP family transporter [Actinomycetales bacterium]|nr:TSUP family transporter [Actinomycetales bacterium]
MLALVTALSVFVGIALGLLGGGGSILTVPLLVYVGGLDAKAAIASSLFVVGVTSLFGMASHARAGRVRWRTGLVFGGAGMAGAFVGGRIGSLLPDAVLLVAFATMMAVTAVAMIRGRRDTGPGHTADLPVGRTLLIGTGVGLVTGLVGAGGGFLIVPALALLGGLAMPSAVGTSLLVIAMNSFAGFAGHATSTSIDWRITLLVTSGAVVGAFVGSALAGRIPPARLRAGFGWFVLAMAAFILTREVGGSLLAFASTSVLDALLTVAGLAAVVSGILVTALKRPRPKQVEDADQMSKPAVSSS